MYMFTKLGKKMEICKYLRKLFEVNTLNKGGLSSGCGSSCP